MPRIKDINPVDIKRFIGLLNKTVKGFKYKEKVIIWLIKVK
jgi:hypothetical protein